MIAFLREQMTKIGFRAAYFLGCEHLEDGGHTPKIVVLVSTEEVDMDYFCFLFIQIIQIFQRNKRFSISVISAQDRVGQQVLLYAKGL